jgi:PAS domain S-box-containing protein
MSKHFLNNTTTAVTILFCLGYMFLWGSGVDSDRHLADELLAAYFLSWGLYTLLSKTPRLEIQKRFLLTTGTLMVCIGLMEAPAVIRLVDYREVFSSPGYPSWWNAPAYIEDNELVWIHQPHYQTNGKFGRGNIGKALCVSANATREYDVRYDHNGFRNATDLVSADIAVIGDSYVESPLTPSGALMTTVLGELENSTVANLGISGYGPQQELIVLKRYALPLHPKTIVWVFYEGNDLRDVDQYENDRQVISRPQNHRSALAWFWDRSFTRNLLSTVVRVRQKCEVGSNTDYFAIVKDAEGKERRQYFLADVYSATNRESEALGTTRASLTAAYQFSREQGIRLSVVFAPAEFRVYSGLSNVVEVSEKAKHWVVNDLPERLRTIVAGISPQIDYLDLTPIFRAETEEGIPVFLSDDTHWTNEGHRLVAQALHRSLAAGFPAYVEQQPREKLKRDVVFDVIQDAMMVRDADGTIRYWNKSAQDLYGWTSQEALGKRSHDLLKTIFPQPLSAIEKEVAEKKSWHGELVHKRRDGSQVIVSSRWELQQNPKDGSMTVVEINSKHIL